MKYVAQLIVLFIFIENSFTQDIKVGLFYERNIKQVVFSYNKGSYNVYGDDTVKIWTILPNESIELKQNESKISVFLGSKLLGIYSTIKLVPNKVNASIRIKCIIPNLKQRKYQDQFLLKINENKIQIVNNVSKINYLSGVLESEGGANKPKEFYKVQAVLSRTYLTKNWNRHRKDKFQVCDDVHCQAYLNMLRYTPYIRDAVKETKNEVVVDSLGRLTEGFFHANCGGQTSPSDFVWNKDIDYLKSIKDTFCIYTRQAHWQQKISKIHWRNYLINQFNFPENDTLYKSLLYSFNQNTRKAFFQNAQLGIPLRDIRKKFKLKSTFFSCQPEGDYVLIRGKGYGHGVGMCQEGTMKMAISGFNYKQIITFYFTGVKIIELNKKKSNTNKQELDF